MLNRHGHVTSREETERVDTLRYTWQQLLALAADVTSQLTELEPYFRRQLIDDVSAFILECEQFYKDYEEVNLLTPRFTDVWRYI